MEAQRQSDKIMDQIKKATLFGMGVAAISYDKVRKAIDDMVDRGEMTTEEGKKTFDDITQQAENEGRHLNERIRIQIREMFKDMGLADKAQIALLESRIEGLERRVRQLDEEQFQNRAESTEG